MSRFIALLMMCLFVSAPMLAAAQDLPVEPLPPAWLLVITRDEGVYWIGEEVAGAINGTANTTISIEMRPIFNGTVQNATYQAYQTTNANGSCTFIIARIDEPGDYRLQVLVNQMVVVFQDILFNFDPVRWNEIQHERVAYHNWQQDNALLNKTLADKMIWNKMGKQYWLVVALGVSFACYVVMTLELQLNYHIYKRKKAGKRPSKLAWLLSDSNSEFFHQAGGIIYDEPPVLPQKINGQDLGWTGYVGKNTRDIIKIVNERMINRKIMVHKMPPSGLGTRFSRKRERDRIKKEIEKKTEEPLAEGIEQTANYTDLYKEPCPEMVSKTNEKDKSNIIKPILADEKEVEQDGRT